MMFSLDQMYLMYKHRLHKYKADIVVVGLSSNPTDGLGNQYIPFRFRSEVNMPFLKPRFELKSGGLKLLPVPGKQKYENLFKSSDLLELLSRDDLYYKEFRDFTRFGILPLSGSIWYIYKRAHNLTKLLRGDFANLPLLKLLMYQLDDEATGQNAFVIFMILPDSKAFAPTSWRKFLPDHFGRLIDELTSDGIEVLDVRDTFRQSGLSRWDLYIEDGIHYTPNGNRIIAQLLYDKITTITENKPDH